MEVPPCLRWQASYQIPEEKGTVNRRTPRAAETDGPPSFFIATREEVPHEK